MDFVCWAVETPEISKLMLNLADEIGYLGLRMFPSSLMHELELIWYVILFQLPQFLGIKF